MSEEDRQQQRARRLLKAVAQTHRLCIVRALLCSEGGALCVHELVEQLAPLTQSTVSGHLRILRDTEIVCTRKQGLYHYYMVRFSALAEVQHIALLNTEDIHLREDAMNVLALLRDHEPLVVEPGAVS